jgi:hypothetical protein
MEMSSARGAFYQFLIEISPPDLRAVIRLRLRRALSKFKRVRREAGPGISIEFSNIERSLNSLSEKILTPRNQEALLRDICNNNVRKALSAFEYFCRYRDLRYQLLFSFKRDSHDELQGTWFDHLLDGLMIGDREFFTDGAGPILNILVFEQSGRIDRLILYVCLSLLNWAGRFIEKTVLMRWLAFFGYDRSIGAAALDHLLRRGLIYSPETEYDFARARNFKLSDAGAYYINTLIQLPQYLYNAVYDVPLAHGRWKEGGADAFSVHMASIMELVQTVFSAETKQLAFVCSQKEHLELLGSIRYSGTMTRRLIKGATDLIDRGHLARFERARQTAAEFAPELEVLSKNLTTGERIIEDTLLERNLVPKMPSSTKVVERDVGVSSGVRLIVPREIGPTLQNRVKVELTLVGIEETEPVVLYWQGSTADARHEEIVELKRSGHKPLYQGEFVISGVTRFLPFPDSKITVFSASNPILVTHIFAPT